MLALRKLHLGGRFIQLAFLCVVTEPITQYKTTPEANGQSTELWWLHSCFLVLRYRQAMGSFALGRQMV